MRSITDSGTGVGYERRHGQCSEPTMVNLGLPRFDGQGWWLVRLLA
jgi:hypothetical protein